MFALVMIVFAFLVNSDPGFIENKNKVTLLNLVESKMKINDICPSCIVTIFLI